MTLQKGMCTNSSQHAINLFSSLLLAVTVLLITVAFSYDSIKSQL